MYLVLSAACGVDRNLSPVQSEPVASAIRRPVDKSLGAAGRAADEAPPKRLSLSAIPCKRDVHGSTPADALQSAIDGLEGSGAWITLIEQLGAEPLSCAFTLDEKAANASKLTVWLGRWSTS